VVVDWLVVEDVDVVAGTVAVAVAVVVGSVPVAAVLLDEELVVVVPVVVPAELPQPAATTISVRAANARMSFADMSSLLSGTTKRAGELGCPFGRGLLQALARFAHERNGLGEDHGHNGPQLLGLLFGRPLDVGAIHRGDRQIDGQLDGVISPGQPLRALHLLGKLAEAALQIVRVAEQTAETTSFHASNGSSRRAGAGNPLAGLALGAR
jgi:hypothetical protein